MTDLNNSSPTPVPPSNQPTSKPEAQASPKLKNPSSKGKKILNFLVSLFSILTIILVIIGTLSFFFVYLPARKLYAHTNTIQEKVNALKLAVSEKDLSKVQKGTADLKSEILLIQRDYSQFKLLGSLPYLRDYYSDGNQLITIAQDSLDCADIVVKAVEPYQDFLGLKGSATDSAKTTEDRIAFLTESVGSLIPHLDTIEAKIADIENSLNQIDPSRYPEEIKGFKVQSNILKAKELVSQAHKLVRDDRPILSHVPWLLGKDKPRTYLLMFQNDAELRPTGGFWTAYGIIKVDNGKVTPSVSGNMYDLDDKLNSTIPAPRPIKSYHINVPYWYLRDMNLSPDFPTSIETFLSHYNKISGSKDKIDAVIALDTQVLVDIVKVLGRVGVPGYGNFSADPDKRCDGCPQIIYELEYIAGKPRNYIDTNRKGFLSPLMHSLLVNAMGSEKSKIAPLAQNLFNDVIQKHVLFYFVDPKIQEAAKLANIAGALTATDNQTDYLHLNDSNMSSAKSNLFVTQKIKHEIISQNGKVEHKLTVTYNNPSKASNCNMEKGDLCLNAAKYRDWFRFYVPKGSTLQKMTGSEVEPLAYEELDKQVFEGFYGNKYPLYAQSSLRTSIQYTSSILPSSNYSLMLQKQPGTKPVEYELVVNGKPYEKFNWVSDKLVRLSL
jgi:hypothetical protein